MARTAGRSAAAVAVFVTVVAIIRAVIGGTGADGGNGSPWNRQKWFGDGSQSVWDRKRGDAMRAMASASASTAVAETDCLADFLRRPRVARPTRTGRHTLYDAGAPGFVDTRQVTARKNPLRSAARGSREPRVYCPTAKDGPVGAKFTGGWSSRCRRMADLAIGSCLLALPGCGGSPPQPAVAATPNSVCGRVR
jgi:hypothetical protein